ncbi:hypothetical protein KL86DES1_20540 [uncultured Desulfovibrio sp.]|uniref:Uncharacterized protein n=1 Tax=uncultured Desulfovibrio sp. TaxID=167968 RepID=A0A212L484_9BACT|nr:hypothetical protein KL86DES1_20540 [uncultured Desulfovibrio sp.]VZH33444.1 conserved protein of unknown function [Desulfovibrio sp. 86]
MLFFKRQGIMRRGESAHLGQANLEIVGRLKDDSSSRPPADQKPLSTRPSHNKSFRGGGVGEETLF